MATGLRQDALARVDQDDREIGGRGAGRHIAGILLVSGRIGDDEGALFGVEIAIGDIDGDALFALGGKTVHQKREIERAVLRAEFFRVAVERGELILGDGLRVIEHPADQSRFAVVDRAAGDEAQQGFFAPARRGERRRRSARKFLFGKGVSHQK